jgi:hypothetical protein
MTGRSLVLSLGVIAFATLPVVADTIDFNDLATPDSGSGIANWGVVPSSYDGLMWSGWEVVDGQTFNTVYGTPIFSGPFPNNAAYNGGDGNLTVSISSGGGMFDLDSADLSYWPDVGSYASGMVTIAGYRSDVAVGAPVVVELGTGFALTAINLDGIDSATFTSSGEGKYWLMDNLTVTSTPEPGPAWPFALGGALLLVSHFIRRRCESR